MPMRWKNGCRLERRQAVFEPQPRLLATEGSGAACRGSQRHRASNLSQARQYSGRMALGVTFVQVRGQEPIMLPLGGRDFPKSRDELVTALAEGLSQVAHLPPARQIVEPHDDTYPILKHLPTDLTGRTLTQHHPPP